MIRQSNKIYEKTRVWAVSNRADRRTDETGR